MIGKAEHNWSPPNQSYILQLNKTLKITALCQNSLLYMKFKKELKEDFEPQQQNNVSCKVIKSTYNWISSKTVTSA